jgi:uncharacterized membrane protein YjjP (DUF1212 family)
MTDPESPVQSGPRWRHAFWREDTAPMPIVRSPNRPVYPQRRQWEIEASEHVDEAVQVALRLGAVLLAGGAPTEDVEAAMFAAGTALGLEPMEVDVTYNTLVISVPPKAERPGVTDMRVVRSRTLHHARLAAANQLVSDIVDGRVNREDLDHRVSTVEHRRQPIPAWFGVLAAGVLAGAVVVGLGGDGLTAVVAIVSASLVGVAERLLSTRAVPTFFLNLAFAWFATVVAVAVTYVDWPVKTALVVAGGIIMLLPGMSLVVATQEAIGSFPLTAAARFVDLTVATTGIVVGVILGLLIADRFGVSMYVSGSFTGRPQALWVAALAGGVAAMAAGVTYRSPLKLVPIAGLVAAVGATIHVLLENQAVQPAVAVGVAAIVVGLAARLLMRRMSVPFVLLVAPAIIPLLPGLTVYRGLLALSQGRTAVAVTALVSAIAIAIAIAAGVRLGELLGGSRTRAVARS